MTTATTLGLKAGDTVQIIRGGYKGMVATLVRCDGSSWPWFTLTRASHGREVGRQLAIPLQEGDENAFIVIPEGDKGGFILNTGDKPRLPTTQRVDILYKDGSLILNAAIGYTSYKASNTDKSYSSNHWALYGGESMIVGYRLRAEEVVLAKPAASIVPSTPQIEKEIEMKVGDRVVLVHTIGCAWFSSNNGKEGVVTRLSESGVTPTANVQFDNGNTDWGRRAALRLVEPALVITADATDKVLAQLKAQIEAAAKEIEQANITVVAATARHAALVATLTKHGFTVGSGAVVEVDAKTAFDQKLIKKGTLLRCNTVCEGMVGEHIAGKTYRVTSVDHGSLADQELESEDGYGIWVDNDFLKHYTVVSFS